MNRSLGRITIITLASFVLSIATAQAPQASPPPLVPCDDAAQGMPCVAVVTEVADIVGVWRRYYAGASDMAFTEFRHDGTLSIVQSLPGDTRVSGTVTFEDGVAAFAANPDGPAPPECMMPGRYALQLIRAGDLPIALTYSLVGEDPCLLRVNDFSMPMIAYTGSGEELAMDPDVPALAQPLVPCPEAVQEAHPCDVVATHAADAAGIWKHYAGRPDLQTPDGMGYQRIDPDGSFHMADTPEHTAAIFRNFPYGTYAFDGNEVRLTVDAPNVPPTCRRATLRFHVYRYGTQPVALLGVLLDDDCPPRLQDMNLPFIWVAGAD